MKRTIVIVALVTAILGGLAIRVVGEGRAALTDGDDALARGGKLAAIRAYEVAARWYLPLAPHVDEAYAKLHTLAGSEEPAVKLAAWRAIRSAARATRSLWQPHADDLAAADREIARLAAADPAGGHVADKAAPEAPAAREAWHRDRLARDTRASTFALVLAALGDAGWLGGGLALARRGIDATGRLVRRPALASAIAIVLGLVCWAAGISNA
nr:hypothetical protein [Kofleriaceae bacterium]